MFDDDDDNTIFILTLGVLAGILAVVAWWFTTSADRAFVPAPTEVAIEAPAAQYLIEVNGTNAVLTGDVASDAASDAAEAAALQAFDTVDNQLVVVGADTVSDSLAPIVTVVGTASAAVVGNVDGAFGSASWDLTNNLATEVQEPDPEPGPEPTPEPTAVPAPAPAPTAVPVPAAQYLITGDGTSAVLTGEVATERASTIAETAALRAFDSVDNQLVIVGGDTVSATLAPIVTVVGSAPAGVVTAVDGAFGVPSWVLTNNLEIVAPAATGESVVADLNDLFRLDPIQFDTGSAVIRAESEGTLDQAVALLTQVPDAEVEIGGHTDNRGSEASNQNLSQDRADSVRAYLIGGGVSESQLTAVGFGELEPIADNDTAEGRQENRRIEFSLLNG